jgi:hypothetical protein
MCSDQSVSSSLIMLSISLLHCPCLLPSTHPDSLICSACLSPTMPLNVQTLKPADQHHPAYQVAQQVEVARDIACTNRSTTALPGLTLPVYSLVLVSSMLSFPISSYFSCSYLWTFILIHIIIISICPPILVADMPTPYSQTPICLPSYHSGLCLPIHPCHMGLVAGRSSLIIWTQHHIP